MANSQREEVVEEAYWNLRHAINAANEAAGYLEDGGETLVAYIEKIDAAVSTLSEVADEIDAI